MRQLVQRESLYLSLGMVLRLVKWTQEWKKHLPNRQILPQDELIYLLIGLTTFLNLMRFQERPH